MGSPADQRALAPVDVRPNGGWQRYIRGAFLQKYPASLAWARGYLDNAGVSVARVPNINNALNRPTAPRATGGSRGSMANIPTPQALIRQVTGVGDPTRGR